MGKEMNLTYMEPIRGKQEEIDTLTRLREKFGTTDVYKIAKIVRSQVERQQEHIDLLESKGTLCSITRGE